MGKNINKTDDRMEKFLREISIKANNSKHVANGSYPLRMASRNINNIERIKKEFISFDKQYGFSRGLYHSLDIIHHVINNEELHETEFHKIVEDDIYDQLINFNDEIVKFKKDLILMKYPNNNIDDIFNNLISEVIVINSLNITRLHQHYSLMFNEKEDNIFERTEEIIVVRGFLLGLYFAIESLIDNFSLDGNKYLDMKNKVFRNKTFSQLSKSHSEKNLMLLNDIEQSYDLEWI